MKPQQLTDRFLYYPDSRRSGGTADIFEGVDLHDRGAKVAIKLVKEIVVTRELAALAFEREMQCLGRLSHPNIVKWIDAGRDPETGRRYFVSEWLEDSLFEHLKATKVAGWDDFFAAYALPIMQALKYAFEQGVIHRDIKPNNLMVGNDGLPKLVDFGIARFNEAPRIGVTLASFKSVPYAPPDSENPMEEASRDVWGFAASCVACLNLAELSDYNALEKEFEQFDVPPEIDEIFEKALARDPSQRYLSILDFAADLETAQRKRQYQFAPLPDIAVAIPNGTLLRMQQYYPNADLEQLRRRIVTDLNTEAAFQTKEREKKENGCPALPDIEIVSGEHQYIAAMNSRKGAPLVIKGMKTISSFHADKFVSRALRPGIVFSLETTSNDGDETEKVLQLISEIEDNTRRLLAAQEKLKEEEFFSTWRDVLRLKTSLADSQGNAIRFSSREIVGNRVELHCDHVVDESVIGQRRAVHLPSGYQIRGEIEDVSGTDIIIYLDEPPAENFPDAGVLAADNAATKLAIQRQQGAIDAIQFGRNVGSNLKRALINPQREPDSIETDIPQYFLPDLDPPKRLAVSKGVSENALTLVQGPPGTGKTQLIVELILQLVCRNAGVRILLTSQTHIALDNVLERLMVEAPDIQAVRVGRVSDRNKSEVVKPLMLEEIANRWKKETARKSDDFLNNWAANNQINYEDIHLGRAVSRYIAAKREMQKVEAREKEIREQLDETTSNLAQTHSDAKGETAFEKLEAGKNLQEDRDEIQRQKRAAKQQVEASAKALKDSGEDGKALAGSDVDELGEWERTLLGTQLASQKFRRMLDLAEEWQLRFLNSQELHPAILSSAQVVAGTCIGFAGAKGILDVEFDVCIVDEASKATASEICVPMSRAGRSFIVGDHKQLPPFLEDGLLRRQHLEKYGLDIRDVQESLFERMYQRLPASHRVLLSKQYRMLPEIGDLVSTCFYPDERLTSEPRQPRHDLRLGGIPKPVTWVSTSGLSGRREIPCSPGFKNVLEAEAVREMLRPLNFCLSNSKQVWSVALLTGYVEQREELRRQSNRVIADLDKISIQCGTVDSFQGRQIDIGIFSVTRSNEDASAGFLGEMRRLNVALSRAKEALVIVGDFEFALSLPTSNPLRAVAEYISRNTETCSVKAL